MTTDVLDRPPTAPTARENREGKGRDIARHAWRLGLSADDLHALPYASRDRAARTMTRFAREAYAAAGTDRQPPHGRTSGTWGIVAEKLEQMTSRAARGLPVPERDLLGERELWLAHQLADAPADAPPIDDEPRAATQEDIQAEADELTEGLRDPVPDPSPRDLEPSADGLSVFDAILGAKCPGCGWRRGLHRPRIGRLTPCPTSGRTS